MVETNFFLNHIPEGSWVIYEFHKDRPAHLFDYHQIYSGSIPVQSQLLSPSALDWVQKAHKVREKYTDCENQIYLEWDYPEDGHLQRPAVFVDFGKWWIDASRNVPPEQTWKQMLLETAQAAGFDFSLEDIPDCPDVAPFHKITYGFFPDRDQTVPWFRVACAHTVAECQEFAEKLGFSTKWFDYFNLEEYVETCLISFNISSAGVTKPAAEMILKPKFRQKVPKPFAEFEDLFSYGMSQISKHHGKYLYEPWLCHFKVTLTDESYEKREAKMYIFGNVRPEANG